MKILWLRPTTGKNVSSRRERIANHLEDRGVDVTLRNASGLSALNAVKSGLVHDYDVVIGNVRIGLYIGYPLAKLRSLPFIGDVSDPIDSIRYLPSPLYKLFQWYEWKILARSDAIFVVENKTYEVAEQKGLDPIMVRNAVDYTKFADPTESLLNQAKNILESNGVNLKKPIAIYIGSMVPNYNLTKIGRAASITPEWEFVFIGKERGAKIQEIVSSCSNAHYLGSFDYELMPGFLAHASCGFCLVDKEQPLKIMEYGAAGLATMGYDGKLRTNFTEDELIFVDADPENISRNLTILSQNPEEAKGYGANLQQKAKKHSWESVAETYYEQLRAVSQR